MSSGAYPSFADYQSALQHPEMAFSHNFLRQGSVESDLWGFPRVRSGGFALTYKISLNDITWAARCFHRVVRDRSMRYTQICQVLEEKKLPFFLPTRYMHRGIVVQGKYLPISILEWVDGESLETYVLHNLETPERLLGLSEKFRDVCRQLEINGIAHGDLSHRNILIKSDEIYLIDYDGLFVPALSGRKSSELGNIHFQHPQRTNTLFDNHMDRFSSIVIYLALLSLANDPSLWKRFQSGGEGLLFQRSDFLNPGNSQLLHVLEKTPFVSKFIPRLRQICQSPVEEVPSLEDLVSQHAFAPQVNVRLWDFVEKKIPEIPTIDALSAQEILHAKGEIVTIVGKVTEVFHGYAENKEEHVFINFGNWQESCFTGVLWGTVLADIQKLDLSIDSWAGQWMSITGLVTDRNLRPQIQLEAVTDFVILESEEQALHLLKREKKHESSSKKTAIFLSPPPTGIQNGEFVKPRRSNKKSTEPVTLTDLFEKQANPSVEAVINQLYSSGRFKKRRKRGS